MNDDELRAALARRASAPLSADARNDLLRASRLEALKPAPRLRPDLFSRVAGYLVGAVALLVLVLIALPILLSPPSVAAPSPNPSDLDQPTLRVVQVPPSLGEQSPSPTAPSGSHVYSDQELANLIGDPNWVGRTVLADLPAGAIGHDPCASPLGTPVISCNLGSLNVHGPHSTVVVGLRDATPADGRQYDEGNGYGWVKPLEWPMQAGAYAFQVNSNDLDYLGPAHPSNGTPTSVADTAKAASQPSDDVYVVSGWLGHTLPAPCAFPQQGLESPMPDISSYYCGGSWLADQQWDPPTSGLSIDGGMHVQNDAYDTYAPNPETGGADGASRFGTYLVRNAGCPEVVTGDCPVWRMVGRLDQSGSALINSPLPTSAPSAAPGIQIPTGTQPPNSSPQPCPAAVRTAFLVADATYGVATQESNGAVGKIVWPYGYTAISEGDRVALLDENGQVLAYTGDYVSIGGGDMPDGSFNGCGGVTVVGPDGSSPPTATVVPEGSSGAVEYVHLVDALVLARAAVNQLDPQLRSYAPGSYQSVSQILLGPTRLTELPAGLTWDSMVWGVQYSTTNLLTTVYLDLFTGDVVDVTNTQMPPDPTPIHKSDIVFEDPAVHASNATTLDLSIYVNDTLAAVVSAAGATQVDPRDFGPGPWTIRTTTPSGRDLTTGVLDPKNVWAATGDYPLESQSFLERIDLSCGRLDIWAGSPASGPAPFGSYPPGDCDP